MTAARYPTCVYDGRTLTRAVDATGIGCPTPAAAVEQARSWYPDVEPVVWVHELAGFTDPSAAALAFGGRAAGAGGWLLCRDRLDKGTTVHVALPAVLGAFAGSSSPSALGCAVETWRATVDGFAFLFSAASTVHQLITRTGAVPEPVEPDPRPEGWAATSWAVPAHYWRGVDDLDELARLSGARMVLAYDRTGSYLSAWSGCTLPAGGWSHVGAPVRAVPGPEREKPCGYWLARVADLPDLGGLFAPWDRQRVNGRDPGETAWLTTPLVQLAVELAGPGGGPVDFLDAWWADDRCRPLDPAARRLSAAHAALSEAAALGDEPARLARATLKDGYAGAVAWFEYGPDFPQPLARPSWRHAILDRYVANTWRALNNCTPGPFALADIDCALFLARTIDDAPNLRAAGLGSWKPKGAPVPIARAASLYASGGPRAVIREAEL